MKKHLILAALFGAIALILAPQGANAQPAPPAQATAAGMTSLVFDDEFTSNTLSFSTGSTTVSGAKWYPYNWDASTSSTASIAAGTGGASGTLTITDGCMATCPTYPNTALATPPGTFKHFYAEARLQYPTNTGSTTGWPAFWSYGVAPAATSSQSITVGECDFIEAIWTGNTIPIYPCNTIHNWVYTPSGSNDTANTNNNNDMESLQGSSESAYPDANWHTYGCLWTQTGANTGKIQFYYDNNLIVHSGGVTSFNVGAGTPLTGMENYPVCLILSTNGPAALKVNWVHVWQTSGGTTGSSPSTTAQTVASFPSTLSLSTSQSPYSLPANTDQGLALTYSVASGPATVSGNTLTLTGAGTVVLNATQAGNSTYSAYSGTETITVTTVAKTAQTVSNFPSTLSLSTTASPYSLTSATSAGLSINYSVTSGPATVSGHSLTLTGAGTVVVNATQAGNSTYAAYSGTETITVTTPGTQTLANFPSTQSLTMAQTPYTLPSATTAGLTVTYTVVSGPATVSGNTLTLTGAGTVVLNARQAGNSSYAAYSGTQTITVTTVTQTIAKLPASLSLTTSQSPYTLPAKTDQGLTISYSIASGSGSVSGDTLTLNGAGTVAVSALQAGNATYSSFLQTTNITVTNTSKTAQTVTGLPTSLSLTTAQSPYTLPAKTDQGLAITYSLPPGPGGISGNVLSFSTSNTLKLSASQAGNGTYAAWSEQVTVTITTAQTATTQTVSNFPSTLSLTMAQTPYTLPASTDQGLTLSYNVVSGPATVSGHTLTLIGAGTVVLSANQGGNSTYASYSGAEAITVTTVAQTVSSFPSSMNLTTGASPYALPANTDQGQALSYSVVSGPGTVSGHSLTLTGAGTLVIKATQAGNATYAAYTGSETINVTTTSLGTQAVSSFPSTQNVTLGSGAVSLTAKTSAGQTITYTVVSGPATISGDTLTITGSGTVVISASAAGTSDYAAYSGTETITVTSGSTMTFTQWEGLYFNSTQMGNSSVSGATATPQNDGVPNLLKYVYDINPSQAMSTNDYNAMPATDVDTTTTSGTTYLTLTYRQYAKVTGVTIQVQTSPDLQTWTTVTPSISKQISTDPNTGDPIIEDEVNTNGQAAEFIRLNVTSP